MNIGNVKLFPAALSILLLTTPGFGEECPHPPRGLPEVLALAGTAKQAADSVPPSTPLPSCTQRLAQACSRLSSAPAGIISRNPSGLVRLNPTTLTRDLPADARALLEVANINPGNFNMGIVPLFERLRSTLTARVGAMPADSAVRGALLLRLSKLDLRVENFERCTRETQPPIVARYADGAVLICPIMTHFDPIEIASMLAHELGHVIDLCDEGYPQPPVTAGFPFEAIHACASRTTAGNAGLRAEGSPPTCDRDGELYADYIGTALVSATLRPSEFSSDPVDAAIQFAGFRLLSACYPSGTYAHFGGPILQSGLAQRALACSGVDIPTACSGVVEP
ncbi:MAG: hypothetical protein IT285_14880 [Bdellovibrionales bacterium]|nr:hypothetical protein [Bdellovibrionales bacterium]